MAKPGTEHRLPNSWFNVVVTAIILVQSFSTTLKIAFHYPVYAPPESWIFLKRWHFRGVVKCEQGSPGKKVRQRVWLGLSVQYLLPGMRWWSCLDTEASHGLCLNYQKLGTSCLHPVILPKQPQELQRPPSCLLPLTSNLLASSLFSLTLPSLFFPQEHPGILPQRKPTTLCHHVLHLTCTSRSLLPFKEPLVNLSTAGCLFSDITWTTRRPWEAEQRREGLASSLVPTLRLIIDSLLLN